MPAPKLRIVFAGVFDAYPKLKFILGHLAEMLPFAMHRLHEHTYYTRRRLRTVLDLIQGIPVARPPGARPCWVSAAFPPAR